MSSNTAHGDSSDHEATLDVLSRYAELVRDGEDVEAMYPEVARHLEACSSCRALLADLLRPSAEEPVPALNLDLDNLFFLQLSDGEPEVHVMPGSRADAFRLHISLLPELTPEAGAMRGSSRSLNAMSYRDELLFADIVRLGDVEIGVKLTLDEAQAAGREATGVYDITGELAGEGLPPVVNAELRVGRHLYTEQAQVGHLRFEGVGLREGQRISLTLESPE